MYSRYSDVSLKDSMWRKICIHYIERISMMLKRNIPKNGAKEELPRIGPLTSRFPHSDLDLNFFARKFQIEVHKHCKTVYCAYAYHYILLFQNIEQGKEILFEKADIALFSGIVIDEDPSNFDEAWNYGDPKE
jgi:hypothetical protein